METKKTQFSTGAVRDSQEGKPLPSESVSYAAMWEFAKYMAPKAAKYGAGNFKKGIPNESAEESLARHFFKYQAINEFLNRGYKLEDIPAEYEPFEDHASAMIFNLMLILMNRVIK